MTPRQAQRARRATLPALAGLAVAALVLAGCTSRFLTEGGIVAEPAPTVTETPTPEPQPTTEPSTPEPDYDCDDLVLNRPGNYVLGACGTVTVEGAGVQLTFTSIARLVLRGDRADVLGTGIGTAEVEGQDNEFSVDELGSLRIRGEGNTVIANGRIGSVVVDGNENVVSAGDGVGSAVDNGLLNEIG